MTTSAFSVAERNSQLQSFATRAVFASLHTDFPADTGANEVTGGTPPYARQPITWGVAAAAAIANAINPSFAVPAGTTVKWLGYWTAITGGTFLGAIPVGSGYGVLFSVDQSGEANTLLAPSHTFTNGQKVVLMDSDVSVLPTGITEGTDYFVINAAAADSFQLALTAGGAAIVLTDGGGFAALITPETFNSAGTYASTSISISYTR